MSTKLDVAIEGFETLHVSAETGATTNKRFTSDDGATIPSNWQDIVLEVTDKLDTSNNPRSSAWVCVTEKDTGVVRDFTPSVNLSDGQIEVRKDISKSAFHYPVTISLVATRDNKASI